MFSANGITAILVAIALCGSLGILLSNRQTALRIANEAKARRWRYTRPTWNRFYKAPFRVAGQTTTGAVWELRQISEQKKLKFLWKTFEAPLPYGSILIVPASAEPDIGIQQGNMMAAAPLVDGWPVAYKLYTTHSQLAQLFADERLVDALNQMAAPPTPSDQTAQGALVRVVWQQQQLSIVCDYQTGWELLDKLVGLGDALTMAVRL